MTKDNKPQRRPPPTAKDFDDCAQVGGYRAPRTMAILLLEIPPLWRDARFHC